MQIRKTTTADLPAVMQIYAEARQVMAETGNATQWGENHPPQHIIEEDIAAELSYVCETDYCEVVAVFYFDTTPDPTYAKIDGAWINDEPYGVVHRIARTKKAQAKGAGAFCLDWCFSQIPNIRIDTHRANAPMLKLLDNLGYKYCGVICLDIPGADGERLSFQKVCDTVAPE